MSLRKILLAVLTIAVFPFAFAANSDSPVGFWKTYDRATKEPSSIVEIYEDNNTLKGKVVKLLKNPNATCTQCQGDQKNQPVQGMVILWDLAPNGNDSKTWSNGHLLDPKTGKVFGAQLTLNNDGSEAAVKASAGIGSRSVTWTRIERPQS